MVTVETNVEVIPTHCFSECYRLKKFDFSKVKIVQEYGFCECLSLKKVVAQKLISLGFNGFSHCYNLETVKIPNCYDIAIEAFAGCQNIKTFEAPGFVEDPSVTKYSEIFGFIAKNKNTDSYNHIIERSNDKNDFPYLMSTPPAYIPYRQSDYNRYVYYMPDFQ